MKRYDAIKRIAEELSDEIVVCNLGAPSRELYNIKDRNENFYMLGSMGLASSIALGLALAKPEKRVFSIDGDGSLLMNLGCLSTIANLNPENLILIIIDNGSYGSTGDQPTYTSKKTKLEMIAQGAGFQSVIKLDREEEIIPTLKKLQQGCHFLLIKVLPGNAQVKNVPLHPEKIKNRLMKSITE